jgi:pyruvate,orthophosphate dikinase
MDPRFVYDFDEPADGGRALLGGKGIGLAEMTLMGVPVPAGFTITTDACRAFMAEGDLPAGLAEEVDEHVGRLEEKTGKRFGSEDDPLLVSVRSGAAVSMPGMMDTILNLGLNDAAAEGLAARTGNPRFAFDSYRRLVQMYGEVVDGIDGHAFETALAQLKQQRGVQQDTDLSAEDLRGLVATFKEIYRDQVGGEFPTDARDQLLRAVRAVFRSWDNPRAQVYRQAHEIPHEIGTAVNIVQMVFGNKGDRSGTGVAFTRDPSTGERGLYGEFLANAQGEDVVAGIRTPQPMETMKSTLPTAFDQLVETMQRLEEHYRDVQDIEFTVQKGTLYMLQTRSGKRTAAAALKIAVDMAREGLVSEEEAVLRIEPRSLDQLLHPTLDPKAPRNVLARGLPASPGAASGKIVFSADEAEAATARGEAVILVRIETSPEDIHGMNAAKGILTTRGGMTSHAAVVARGMGRPCVSGAGDLRIDYAKGTLSVRGTLVKAGEVITIDGASGEVFLGEVPTVQPELSGDFAILMGWADKCRTMGVRANAETPADARMARKFGAEGIGLSRTEHMFFEASRILAVREMIMAETEAGRRTALAKILPMQRGDFVELFRIMEGLPVTIRLLDPPLHEFLPHTESEMKEIAAATGTDLAAVRGRATALYESNPMLGHRGCRLGITYPEIYEMQARAIFEAQAEIVKGGAKIVPEVMIPLIATKIEFDKLKAMVDRVAGEVGEEYGVELAYMTGTMIELPRAALLAGKIAETAEFFSFGTNDLTQTTFGLSRDDAGSFLDAYVRQGILEEDPFVSIDRDGVGELVRLAVERGRATRPKLKLGICGEHGGDPASIAFCQSVGLDYVSCSPFRVPIARLAAAQAALTEKTGKSGSSTA